jgi:hypothetical protein
MVGQSRTAGVGAKAAVAHYQDNVINLVMVKTRQLPYQSGRTGQGWVVKRS